MRIFGIPANIARWHTHHTVIAAAILLFSLAVSVSIGAVTVPLSTVWNIILHNLLPGGGREGWTSGEAAIVWNIRFPRALLACLVGSGLALVGTALQAVTRNPLADPHLLGISSGGAFGAILALLHTGLFLGPLTVPLMAFAGACCATLLVLAVARFAAAVSASRLVLVGVAVSFVVMSCANLLIFFGDPRATHTVVFWMLGGLGLAQWGHLGHPLIVLIGCGLFFFLYSAKLDGIMAGDETAASLGIRVQSFRLITFVAAALLTGVMVAYSGIIGFVGLMVPHIARMAVGGSNRRVLPASAAIGAVFLLWADTLARILTAPEDMPIGVVTGLVGGVFFVWLLRRRSF
ncbi:MAG: iron ABC transporter permease [Rhodobacteraceae bacterium]|nr:iron ABC transporter permease [Paracoccaceae bacterium]